MKMRKVRGSKSVFARLFGRIIRDENGAITMEYGLLALLVAAALVAVIMLFSTQIKNLFVGTVKVTSKTTVKDVGAAIDETNKARTETGTDQAQQVEDTHDKLSDTSK